MDVVAGGRPCGGMDDRGRRLRRAAAGRNRASPVARSATAGRCVRPWPDSAGGAGGAAPDATTPQGVILARRSRVDGAVCRTRFCIQSAVSVRQRVSERYAPACEIMRLGDAG